MSEVELSHQEMREVAETVSEVLGMLYEMQNLEAAFQVLASTVSYILCNDLASADDATRALENFSNIVTETVNTASSHGMAMWTEGTTH
jgi:hypothetical protein